MNDVFFQKPAFGGTGLVSGFGDCDAHASTFGPLGGQDHLTFNEPFNASGHRHDFSLETSCRLNGFNDMGGLEQRVSFLDAYNNSPFKP